MGNGVVTPFVTGARCWLGNGALVVGKRWVTNTGKVSVRFGYDEELMTFPGGRARVFARLKSQTDRDKEDANDLSIFGNQQQH